MTAQPDQPPASGRSARPSARGGPRLVGYSDGASRGNPGPASIGGVVLDETGQTLETISRRIGHGTNNEAEYRAAIAVVEAALALGAAALELRMDSELVVRQLEGRYRVRNPALMRHFQRLDALRHRLRLTVAHVPRELNRVADRLANAALDAKEP
jgi:ribonuclease HI